MRRATVARCRVWSAQVAVKNELVKNKSAARHGAQHTSGRGDTGAAAGWANHCHRSASSASAAAQQ